MQYSFQSVQECCKSYQYNSCGSFMRKKTHMHGDDLFLLSLKWQHLDHLYTCVQKSKAKQSWKNLHCFETVKAIEQNEMGASNWSWNDLAAIEEKLCI